MSGQPNGLFQTTAILPKSMTAEAALMLFKLAVGDDYREYEKSYAQQDDFLYGLRFETLDETHISFVSVNFYGTSNISPLATEVEEYCRSVVKKFLDLYDHFEEKSGYKVTDQGSFQFWSPAWAVLQDRHCQIAVSYAYSLAEAMELKKTMDKVHGRCPSGCFHKAWTMPAGAPAFTNGWIAGQLEKIDSLES